MATNKTPTLNGAQFGCFGNATLAVTITTARMKIATTRRIGWISYIAFEHNWVALGAWVGLGHRRE